MIGLALGQVVCSSAPTPGTMPFDPLATQLTGQTREVDRG